MSVHCYNAIFRACSTRFGKINCWIILTKERHAQSWFTRYLIVPKWISIWILRQRRMKKKYIQKKCEKNDIKSLKRATVKQCTKLSKTTATIFLLNSCNSFEFKSFCSRLYIHWSMSSNDISFTQIPSMYARAQHKNVLRFGRISSEFTWNDNFVPVTNTVAWCVFKFHRWRACEWVL